jgi:thioredoxin reductase (NADPH)
LTAGLYAARAGLKTVVLERAFAGGQVVKTDLIENYPGFPQGITGFDLAEQMKTQAVRFGVEIRLVAVERLTSSPDGIALHMPSDKLEARTVVIATGAEPRALGVPGESRLYGRGVSNCAICDGALFRNRAVAVVGGGDAALGEALYLGKLCSKVYVVHRRGQFRAAQVLQDRVAEAANIDVIRGGVVREVVGENRVEGIEVMELATRACRTLAVDALFVYVGESPNTGFLQGVVSLDESGYIITDDSLQTSVARVYAAGDCRKKSLRQVATAVGDGATAATSVERELARSGDRF